MIEFAKESVERDAVEALHDRDPSPDALERLGDEIAELPLTCTRLHTVCSCGWRNSTAEKAGAAASAVARTG